MNPDQTTFMGSLIWVHIVSNLDNKQTRALDDKRRGWWVGEDYGHCMTVPWKAMCIFATFMSIVGYMRVWAPNIVSYTMWG